MAEPPAGVRERKKAETRALIVDVADRLFADRGIENVTLDDIAAACELSSRTLLRYFESKELLALSHEYDVLERFRTGLARRRGPAVGYWRYYIGMQSADIASRPDWFRRRHVMIRDNPTLHLRLLGIHREVQVLMADALAEESSAGDTLAPELLAAMLVAGLESIMTKWVRTDGPFDVDYMLEAIDYATELFADRI